MPSVATAQEIPADCPARPLSDEDARSLAGNWFVKAEGLYKAKKFNKALGSFLCSLEMAKHPNTYFNAAQTAVTAGHKPMALDLGRKCLELEPAEPLKAKAKELVAELEAEGIEVAPPTPPPVAAVEEPAPPEPAEPPDEELPPIEDEPEPLPPLKEEGPNLALPGYVLLGVGGTVLVAGVALQAATGVAAKDAEELDTYAKFKDKRSSSEGMQKGAIACFAIGGAAAITGLVLILADGGEDEEQLAFVPGPGGLVVEGSF